MKSRRMRLRRGSADALSADVAKVENGETPIVERADGYYWVAADGKQEFGPFETSGLARADRDKFDERSLEAGETLEEAESEVGVADWIDPDTGAPAEGPLLPPHLDEK